MKLPRQSQLDGPNGVRGVYAGALTLKLVQLIGFDGAEISKDNPAIAAIEREFAKNAGFESNMKYEITKNLNSDPHYTAEAQVRVNVVNSAPAALTGGFTGSGDLSVKMNMTGRGLGDSVPIDGRMRRFSTVAEFTLSSVGFDSIKAQVGSSATTFPDERGMPYPAGNFLVTIYGRLWSDNVFKMDLGNLLEPLTAEKKLTVLEGI
jgi:hypothetical protein